MQNYNKTKNMLNDIKRFLQYYLNYTKEFISAIQIKFVKILKNKPQKY